MQYGDVKKSKMVDGRHFESGSISISQPRVRPKKILLFPETWTKNRVGRSLIFYNGAYKYTKLLHTFLSLLSSSYIVL